MGRKKKRERPFIFCYYCNRIFENERVLIQHQRAKHFQCSRCNKKISSARGLQIHAFQVHQKTVDSVPGSKEDRGSFDLEIFGMDGVPQDIIDSMRVKVLGEAAAKKAKTSNIYSENQIQIPGMPRTLRNQSPPNPLGMPLLRPHMLPVGPMQGFNPLVPPMVRVPSPPLGLPPPGGLVQLPHPSGLQRPALIMPTSVNGPAQVPPACFRAPPPPQHLRAPGVQSVPQQPLPPQSLRPPLGLSLPVQIPSNPPTVQMLVPPKKKKDGTPVWIDELSQEERRAMVPKYSGHLKKDNRRLVG